MHIQKIAKTILISCLFCLNSYLQAEILRATIFQTSDIHGKIEGEPGGIYRLAGLMKKEVAESGGKGNCLLIDCGDIFAGTPEGLADRGGMFMKYLNYCGYDVFVPGNHDLDLGADNFSRFADIFKGDVLASNLVYDQARKPDNLFAWKIYDRGGLKICVIGMIYCGSADHPGSADAESPVLEKAGSSTMDVSAIDTSLKKIMPEIIRQLPDFIVLAVHQGIYSKPSPQNVLVNILKKYPQINAVFAGHSHEVHAGTMPSGKMWFVQPGYAGEYVSKTILELNTFNRQNKITTELLPGSRYEPDEGLKTSISGDLEKAECLLSTVITDKAACWKTFGEMISENMALTTGVDVGIYGLSYSKRKCCGTITYRDVYEFIPYENKIVAMVVPCKKLKEILQTGFKYIRGSDKYKSFDFSGLDVKKDRAWKITEIRYRKTGMLISDDDMVAISVTSYYASGAGGKFKMLKDLARRKEICFRNSEINQREAFIKQWQSDMVNSNKAK